jgi:hypothetical protein
MTEQRKRHLLIFLPVWIIPVFLITFGSLINFHQNRIWGKQLLPYSYVTPRDKAKVIKIQHLPHHYADFLTSETVSGCLPGFRVQQNLRLEITDEPTGSRIPGAGLRAPPQA